MKNKLINRSIFALVAIFTLLTLFTNGKASAQTTTAPVAIRELRESTCTDSGCMYQMRGSGMMDRYGFGDKGDFSNFGKGGEKEMFKHFLPTFAAGLIGVGIVFSIIGILLLAFWIWMLVHAIKHDIDYKPVWILVIWFMSIIGAIIYYFAVKKKKDCYCCMECEMCEDGKCVCEEVKEEEVK